MLRSAGAEEGCLDRETTGSGIYAEGNPCRREDPGRNVFEAVSEVDNRPAVPGVLHGLEHEISRPGVVVEDRKLVKGVLIGAQNACGSALSPEGGGEACGEDCGKGANDGGHSRG